MFLKNIMNNTEQYLCYTLLFRKFSNSNTSINTNTLQSNTLVGRVLRSALFVLFKGLKFQFVKNS